MHTYITPEFVGGFHVMSYEANFASRSTHDPHHGAMLVTTSHSFVWETQQYVQEFFI